MKTKELCSKLGITPARLRKLMQEGLPCESKGRLRDFDAEAVDAWLLSKGYAEPEPPKELVCETYAELAVALGMTGKDPNRVIAGWMTQPGFPGTAGQPGKRNARLPVEQIRRWLAARDTASDYGHGDDDELRQLDRERRRLQLEFENRRLLEQLGRLADVEEVARFNRQCAADAQAMLRPLADEVLALLPARTPPRVRANIHREINTLLDDALEAIARMAKGDTDGEESQTESTTEEKAGTTVESGEPKTPRRRKANRKEKPKTKAKRKAKRRTANA